MQTTEMVHAGNGTVAARGGTTAPTHITQEQRQILRSMVDRNSSDAQVEMLILVANRYDLDPILGHVVLISGKVFVTHKGLFSPAVRSDFSARDLAQNSVDGKIYGLKMLDDTGILYYRKSLLKAAGIAPPQTMDKLIAAAKTLTVGNRKGLFLGNDGGVAALINVAPWSAGGDFLVGNQIVFNTPQVASAYEKMRELSDSGALLIGAPTDWWEADALLQGQAAMQWGGLWSYPTIVKALGDDIGGMAWPALDTAGHPATFLGGWSAMVNAQGRQIEESKKYLQWLWVDNLKIQEDWCLGYGFHVPPRLSLARSAAPLQTGVAAGAVKDLNTWGRSLPPEWNSAMGTALTDAVTNILKEGRPAAPELAAAAQNANENSAVFWNNLCLHPPRATPTDRRHLPSGPSSVRRCSA